MAEYVQQNIEDMLPELEQLERVGLFTKDETRQILKKRQGYEYRLRRQTKCKEDFLQYIQYEINCLSLLHKRREKTGYSFKQLNIENVIKDRIHKLFRMVTYRFQDDIKLWLSHIAFCESKEDSVRVGKIFTRMLQVHNKKPEIWILAAKWEFEHKNAENSRSTFQRGLRFNPDSKQLFLEYYRMELLYTDKILKRKKILGLDDPEVLGTQKDAILSGKVAMVVYKQAKESFPDDVDMILKFIDISRLFDFTQQQLQQMYTDLKTDYGDSTLTWDALAKQCMLDESGKHPDQTKELKMHEVYEQALTKMNTSEMWGLYIKQCIELMKEKTGTGIKQKRIEKVLNVFNDGSKRQLLTEELYIQWIDILVNVGLLKKAEETGCESVKNYCTSVKLWKKRLLLAVQTGKLEDDILKIFNSAKKVVNEKESWPLWEIILDFLSSNNSPKLVKMLEKGSTRQREISIPIKDFYIQWIGLTSGIQEVRQLYHRLQQLKPLSLQFYKTYLDLEETQSIKKVKFIRQGYEDAVNEYGGLNPDLWLDYIRFESTHGKPENAGVLYYRAIKNLTGDQNTDFISKHTLIQTGHLHTES